MSILYLPDVTHVTNLPGLLFHFAYCKRSKTGSGNGLEMRIIFKFTDSFCKLASEWELNSLPIWSAFFIAALALHTGCRLTYTLCCSWGAFLLLFLSGEYPGSAFYGATEVLIVRGHSQAKRRAVLFLAVFTITGFCSESLYFLFHILRLPFLVSSSPFLSPLFFVPLLSSSLPFSISSLL